VSNQSTRYSTRTFICGHCGFAVPAVASGTRYRNHCPICLWSRHLDEVPGDRAADCGGNMEPVAISPRPNGEWMVVHRCTRCDTLHRTRIAGDDDPLALMCLAVRPLARPPFPLTALLPMQSGLPDEVVDSERRKS
jgi:RNHCP domain